MSVGGKCLGALYYTFDFTGRWLGGGGEDSRGDDFPHPLCPITPPPARRPGSTANAKTTAPSSDPCAAARGDQQTEGGANAREGVDGNGLGSGLGSGRVDLGHAHQRHTSAAITDEGDQVLVEFDLGAQNITLLHNDSVDGLDLSLHPTQDVTQH